MSKPPDRLIRFIDDDQINSLVCHYDEANNLLRIQRKYYNALNDKEKTIIWRAKRNYTFDDIAAEIHKRRFSK